MKPYPSQKPLRWSRLLFSAPAVLAVLLLNSGKAQAAMIQGVTINAVSSEYVSKPDVRRASSLVLDTGFFGDFHTTSPRGSVWLTSPTTAGAYSNAFVTFDLGSVQPIRQMKVWNYNEAGTQTQRGVQTADIAVAGADLVFSTVITNQTFTRAPGIFTNNFAQTIEMGDVMARYVRINVVTNFGNDNRVGLSKVRFINATSAPTIKLVTRNFSGDRVTVKFSEPVLASSATNAGNYTLQTGSTAVSLQDVSMGSFNDRVVLHTATLDSNLVYTLTAQNVRDAADSISIATATVPVDREVVLWLKADAGVTADAYGLVSQWADQSGAGNHAKETNPDFQPMLVPDALNGKPVLRFDGVNDGLASPHSSSLVVDYDLSFFAVVTPQSFTAYNGLASKCGSPDSNTNYAAPFDFELASSTGKPRILRGNGSAMSSLLGNSNAIVSQPCLVEIVIQGTNADHYLNGYLNGRGLFADGIEDQGNPVHIGRRQDASLYLNGDLAEVLLIRGAVTESERLSIDDYLGRKYGIAVANVGVPGFATQPTNILSYVGANVTFRAAVTNGAVPRSLQWYRSPSTMLTGETNEVLTLNNLTLSQDNTSYYLKATNADGSSQSDTATLRVLPVTAPYVEKQPESVAVYPHQPATFRVTARGSTDLTYQWMFGNTVIVGATTDTLTVANTSPELAGSYSVVISNAISTIKSQPATLTVLVPDAGTYPAAVFAANPLIYYRFSDINDTNTPANSGSLGPAWNGLIEGPYTASTGPALPMFGSGNLAFNNDTPLSGGVAFPAVRLYDTNGGAHVTMAAWVYKDYDQVADTGIIFARDSSPCGFQVKKITGTIDDQLAYTWNGGQYTFNSGLLVPNSLWCFVAVVVEPSRATLYVHDGTSMKTATNTATHAAHPLLNVCYIGWDKYAATRRWTGAIDEPMIFDRALTPDQVQALYTGTPILPTSTARLAVRNSQGNVILTWTTGTLQKAVNANGPYSEMIGITSPYTVTPDGAGAYYRLRIQ